MLDMYTAVKAFGCPNFRGTKIQLPSSFIFNEWEAIAHSQVDREVIQYLRYEFPMGFEGSIPTPSFGNHASATNHPRDVKSYITKEIAEGAMLGHFPRTPLPLGARLTLSSLIPNATSLIGGPS